MLRSFSHYYPRRFTVATVHCKSSGTTFHIIAQDSLQWQQRTANREEQLEKKEWSSSRRLKHSHAFRNTPYQCYSLIMNFCCGFHDVESKNTVFFAHGIDNNSRLRKKDHNSMVMQTIEYNELAAASDLLAVVTVLLPVGTWKLGI